MEACARAVAAAPVAVAGVLRPLVALFALRRLELDAGYLMGEGLLALPAGRAIPGEIRCARWRRLYVLEDVWRQRVHVAWTDRDWNQRAPRAWCRPLDVTSKGSCCCP